MEKYYIISYDIGTTGLKSCIYDNSGVLVAKKYCRYETYYPSPNCIEQKPSEWWSSICESTKSMLLELNIDNSKIESISFSGHMNGCVLIDKNGELIRKRTFLWADSRSKEQSIILEKNIGYDRFFLITGGGLDVSMYPALKLLWIKEYESENYKKIYKVLGTKDYIIFKLTGNIITDYSDASGTGLFDISLRKWSDEILDNLDINSCLLPDIHKSYDVVGKITSEAAKATGLKQGTKVVAGGGDVVCASIGAGSIEPKTSYINIGSASWVSQSSRKPIIDIKYRPINLCHIIDNLYASQVIMYGGGISYQWIVDSIADLEKYFANFVNLTVYDLIELKLNKLNGNNENLLFLPFIRGGGAPYFNINSRGVLIGLSASHNKIDIIESVLEGVAFNLRSLLSFLQKYNSCKDSIAVIGGGALSNRWCQIISNICNKNIIRPLNLQESTSFGAAITGGVGVGLFNDFSIVKKFLKMNDNFFPDSLKAKKYKDLYGLFIEANKFFNNFFDKLSKIK